MIESLVPLNIPPGIAGNGTLYQRKGRWVDANGIRFASGTIRPIGGWTEALGDDGEPFEPLAGKGRAAVSWSTATGEGRVAFATTEGLFVVSGGVLQDITPSGWGHLSEEATQTIPGGDYGRGVYTAGPYGIGGSSTVVRLPGNWSLDTFGDWLVAVDSESGELLYWDLDGDAKPAPDAPSAHAVVTTPEFYLVALGADGDMRRVHWAAQESHSVWDVTSDTGAGYILLATQGRIVCGRRTRGQTLIFTDVDVHALEYIGGAFIYRATQVGSNCGIVGPNAVATVDSQTFWMGTRGFFTYDGYVKPVHCEVSDYVFGDINVLEASKAWAVPNAEYNEVWWFYPSAGSTECDRYVVYNYVEGHWTVGELERTAGVDLGATRVRYWLDDEGVIWEHETDTPPEGVFLESGPVEIGSGDQVMKVRRLVPDENALGEVELTLYYSMFPTDEEMVAGPFNPVQPTPIRITARQVRLRFDQVEPDEGDPSSWRIGTMRLGGRIGGRR